MLGGEDGSGDAATADGAADLDLGLSKKKKKKKPKVQSFMGSSAHTAAAT